MTMLAGIFAISRCVVRTRESFDSFDRGGPGTQPVGADFSHGDDRVGATAGPLHGRGGEVERTAQPPAAVLAIENEELRTCLANVHRAAPQGCMFLADLKTAPREVEQGL